jgi:hypothetical protein
VVQEGEREGQKAVLLESLQRGLGVNGMEIVETEETPRSTDKTNVLNHESFVRELHSIPHIFHKRQKSAHMLHW